MSQEIFLSATRSDGQLAGVFEFDDDVGYFYLYNISKKDSDSIVSHIHIMNNMNNLSENNIYVKWNNNKDIVGLYILGKLWAALDIKGGKYGGGYEPGRNPHIPPEIRLSFD